MTTPTNVVGEITSEGNTKPEFFALWSLRDLQVECARLNQVLKECIEIMEKASKTDEYTREADTRNI